MSSYRSREKGLVAGLKICSKHPYLAIGVNTAGFNACFYNATIQANPRTGDFADGAYISSCITFTPASAILLIAFPSAIALLFFWESDVE